MWGPGLFNLAFHYDDAAWAFVDAFAALAAGPAAAGPLAQARYLYWMDSFVYLRGLGRVADTWRRINAAAAEVVAAIASGNATAVDALWSARMVPLRTTLVRAAAAAVSALSSSVFDTGGLGVVANLQQASLAQMGGAVDLTYRALHGARCRPVASSARCYGSANHTAPCPCPTRIRRSGSG